jgi:hypothetical protein
VGGTNAINFGQSSGFNQSQSDAWSDAANKSKARSMSMGISGK